MNMWLLFAFLSPAFYAIAEIFDEFLVTKEFKHPFTVVFYTSLFNLIFVHLIYLLSIEPKMKAAIVLTSIVFFSVPVHGQFDGVIPR